MGQTISEKILAKASGKKSVKPGEIVYPIPDLIICPEFAFPGFIDDLKGLGVDELWNPEKTLVSVDHEPIANSLKTADKHVKLRKYIKELGVKHFFDLGDHGITHILPVEKGFVRPGMFVHSSDTHCPNLGAIGTFASPVVYDMLSVLAIGKIWMKVPHSFNIILTGTLQPGVTARDIGQYVISTIGHEKSDYHAYEFTGSVVENMGIEGRMTLCNVVIEVGAKTGITNPDQVVLDYVRKITDQPFTPLYSDPDAEYEEVFTFDVSDLIPQIAIPPTPDTVVPVTEKIGTRIDQAYIGSCANAGLDDLRAAAAVLKGRKVAPHVRAIITPGTQNIFKLALQEGIIETLTDAGVILTTSGCGACPGAGTARLGEGEVCITTNTRNDSGRMGSSQAEIYLASPMTVAASAIKGEIADPREFL